MKILERIIKLYEEDDDNEWVTTRSGKHFLIDPNGEIQSGNLKGTNIKNFKKNADTVYNKDDIFKDKENVKKIFKKTFGNSFNDNDDSDNDSELEKSFNRYRKANNGKRNDIRPEIFFKKSSDLSSNSDYMKSMDKKFEQLSLGLEGKELDKFKKEYDDAKAVFDNKDAKEIVDMIVRHMYNGYDSPDDEIEKLKSKIKKAENDAERHHSDNSEEIEEYKNDIDELNKNKNKFNKWHDKILKSQLTLYKLNTRHSHFRGALGLDKILDDD